MTLRFDTRLPALILLASLLAAILQLPALQAEPRLTAASDSGYLFLHASHKGLAVKIDGRLIGFTPLGPIELKAGPHQVHVSHPNRANWLDRDWLREIEITAGDTLRLQVAFEKSYSINSQPFGATVFLGERRIGETPLFFNLGEKGIQKVTLSKEGYRDTTFAVGLTDEQFFEIVLRPQIQTVEAVNGEPARRGSKLLLYSTIGLSVLSGISAIYFRDKANDSYERYLRTGNPERFNVYFDDARKYDRVATVAFGTFQVSFIVSFYLFLKEANR